METKAIENFRSGLNCAQSIVRAFTENLKDKEGILLSVSCGFGGGMGRLQETCGAVTGAFMVIGLHNCKNLTSNSERKEATYAMVQNFSQKFKSNNGAIDCKSLLKCDLSTEDGRQYAHQHHLFEKICERCIADSANILEELLKKMN